MTVALEPPLTGSWPSGHEANMSPLLTAPRYMRGSEMSRWHRPRSAICFHDQDDRVSYQWWCGQHVSRNLISCDQPPPGEPVCGTCEGRAVGAGQDDWPDQSKTLLFSPHRLTTPKVCPGSQRDDLYEELSRSVVRCLACGEIVAGRCYGSRPWYGPAGWGAKKHEPGPGLVAGCPFHAWRHLVKRGDRIGCSCSLGGDS